MIRVTTPMSEETSRNLKAGDEILLSGIIYTARDAAHMRLIDALERGLDLPFDLNDQIIYYCGASPTKPGDIIGACGPTTSYRMDKMTPRLLKSGLMGMIGKGERSGEVVQTMKETGAVYFAAIGGAGALTASYVLQNELIAYEDLGAEAIRKLLVKDFKVVVAIDSYGNSVYQK